MSEMVHTEHLSKSYGKKTVLNNVNLALEAGRIVGLCGPNGAGKTTLIKIMTGLLADYKGTIQIDGQKVGAHSKAVVSYLPDILTLPKEMTGLKAASLYQDMYADFDIAIMEDLFQRMRLDAKMPLAKMSKGMRERFSLALTLARRAKVYIFDEPIAGVDPAARDLILETIIGTYTKDALLIISTHLIQDVETVLDEVIFLNDGRVSLHRNCDELRSETGKSIDELFREEFKWSSN